MLIAPCGYWIDTEGEAIDGFYSRFAKMKGKAKCQPDSILSSAIEPLEADGSEAFNPTHSDIKARPVQHQSILRSVMKCFTPR